MSTRANEPVNPVTKTTPRYGYQQYGDVTSSGGLTLREHFAGLAMAAFIAKGENTAFLQAQRSLTEEVASASLDYADALLAELAKEQP